MGQLKVFLSASKSANPINVQIIRDILKKRGCLVFEYDPADPNEQMLGCDLLYIIPPEGCDVIPRITVGRGQYKAIKKWEKEKSKKTIVIINYLKREFVFIKMEQINVRICNKTRIGAVCVNTFEFDMNYEQMCKLTEFIDKPKGVHCANQQQWDFAASKLKRIDKVGYRECGDIIDINSPNNSFFSTSNKASSYEILSFEVWCKENNYSVNKPKWYETLKIGDKVKCIGNVNGYVSRKIGEILTIDIDFSKCKKISFAGDSSTFFEEFELVSRLTDEKPIDPKIALLERAIKEYPIGTKFNSATSGLVSITGICVKDIPKFNSSGNIGTKDNGTNGIIYNAYTGKWAEKIPEDTTPFVEPIKKDLPWGQWYKKKDYIVHLYHRNSVWGFHKGQWFESEGFSEEGLIPTSEYDSHELFKTEILKRYPLKRFTDLRNTLDFDIKNYNLSFNNKSTQIYIPVDPNPVRANASARIFNNGVWAKEVSRFEVGKWYKLGVWISKFSHLENSYQFWGENINTDSKFHDKKGYLSLKDYTPVLITDLSEIQQYLPKEHPDKIIIEKLSEFGYFVAIDNDPVGVSIMKKGDIGIGISESCFKFDSPKAIHLKGVNWSGNKDSIGLKWFKTLGEAEAFARTLDSIRNQTFFINKDEYEKQEVKHIKPFFEPTTVLSTEELKVQLEKLRKVGGLYRTTCEMLSPNAFKSIDKKKKLLKISTII